MFCMCIEGAAQTPRMIIVYNGRQILSSMLAVTVSVYDASFLPVAQVCKVVTDSCNFWSLGNHTDSFYLTTSFSPSPSLALNSLCSYLL